MEAEYEAQKHKDFLPLSIIRAPTIFGPRDPVLLSYFKFIKKGFLPSLGSQPRHVSLCYVKDLVRAFDLAARFQLRRAYDTQYLAAAEMGKCGLLTVDRSLYRQALELGIGAELLLP